MASQIRTRAEIPAQYKWNLAHIFSTQEDWEKAYSDVESKMSAFSDYSGQIDAIPEEAIKFYFSINDLMLPVSSYAFLSKEADNGDNAAQVMEDRVMGLWVKWSTASAFLVPELLELSDERLEAMQNNPAMADYSEFIRTLRLEKPHTLSKEQEGLLAMMGEIYRAPDKIFSMLTSVDMKFPDMEMPDGTVRPLTEGTYSEYRESRDRSVRKSSFDKIFGTYGKLGNTFAAIYGSSVGKDVALARARHYDSALQAAMQPLEIPECVYDNLITVMHESLPILQRYLRLRKRIMGLDELHMYDLYAPMVSDYDMPLTYEEAFDLVLEGLKPMGEDYLEKLREARDGGWIDVYPALNKSSGAFSSGELADVHPYVLLNHNDNLDSAFTIAHELGHSMHSYFSNVNQPGPKRDYSLFVAEVASTCNEAVMMRHLLTKYTDPKAQAYLLNHFLEQFRTTCFRQTMFAEFERTVHEMSQRGEPLTLKVLNEVYYQLNKLYYGETCEVDQLIENEWMRIPHFYRAFYVYVYATGLCAAITLSEKILNEGESAVQDYRKFLSAGCSVPPIDALKLAGIDMSSPEPLRKAMQVFNDTLERFESLL